MSLSLEGSFKKDFPLATLPGPVLSLGPAGALAQKNFAEGHYHGVGVVGPAQKGQILDLNAVALAIAEFGLEHRSPLGQRLAIAVEVGRVKRQGPIQAICKKAYFVKSIAL